MGLRRFNFSLRVHHNYSECEQLLPLIFGWVLYTRNTQWVLNRALAAPS